METIKEEKTNSEILKKILFAIGVIFGFNGAIKIASLIGLM